VKNQGDGFMRVFPSARKAIGCAIDVQRALAKHRMQYSRDPLHVRIGLHTGEVIREFEFDEPRSAGAEGPTGRAAGPPHPLERRGTHPSPASVTPRPEPAGAPRSRRPVRACCRRRPAGKPCRS
jgi:hypothetical protein